MPSEVKDVVLEATARWRPVPAFVLDVAETADCPRIVVLNCVNASGLYAHDAAPIVRAVDDVAFARYASRDR